MHAIDSGHTDSIKREMRQIILAKVDGQFQDVWTEVGMGTPVLSTLIGLQVISQRDAIDWAKSVRFQIYCKQNFNRFFPL
jgi:hypothetical protein